MPGPNNKKLKVLLISDVIGWAFHVNLCDLEEYLKDEFDFEHWHIVDYINASIMPELDRFDTIYCPYHRWGINFDLPWHKTLGSLRAKWFNPDTPMPPGVNEFGLVNQYAGFHVVNQLNYNELKEHCPRVVYLTNPVNMRRFPNATKKHESLIASWNGNAKHTNTSGVDVKGFHSIVRPACQISKTPLEYVEYNSRRITPAGMAEFYTKANVAICASLYEGASNSVMEAMACGQALVSTDSGNVTEMRNSQLKHFGDTGIIIVERSAHKIAQVLNELKEDMGRIKKMGELNREEIKARWSWDVWAERYSNFLKMVL